MVPFVCALIGMATGLTCGAEERNVDSGSVAVVACPNGGSPVCARVASDGAIHLLYDLRGFCWHTVSRDNGRTFDEAVCVIDPVSRKPGLEFAGADMALDSKGRVFVAMSTNAWKLGLSQNEWSLHYATLAPSASTFSPVCNLNNKSSEGFSLAADDRGDVAAVWLSGKLYANFSGDAGQTFSSNAEISAECDPCPCCTTSSVFAPNGDLGILYREEADNNRDMYILIKHRDGRLTRRRISSTGWKIGACPMSCFSITIAPKGYIAAWPTKGQVYFARLDEEGNPMPPVEVATSGRAIMHEGVLGLSTRDGQVLVAWNHDGRLNWRRYDSSAAPIGPIGSIATSGKAAAGVTLGDSRFLLFQ
jgi:hypothetical protein